MIFWCCKKSGWPCQKWQSKGDFKVDVEKLQTDCSIFVIEVRGIGRNVALNQIGQIEMYVCLLKSVVVDESGCVGVESKSWEMGLLF